MKINVLFRNKKVRFFLWIAAGLLIAVILLTLVCNLVVVRTAAPYRQTEEMLRESGAKYDCILVLGALVRPGGELSVVLQDRMDKGLALLQAGFSNILLLSGDSAEPENYDEVGAMAVYAMNAGVEENQIIEDSLGLSTYESLWRAKYIYGAESILIVTQDFHLSRALYLAHQLGMECAGVICDARDYYVKNNVREAAARVKAVYDGLFLPEP